MKWLILLAALCALTIEAALLCSGCASIWWRDSETATEVYPCCQKAEDGHCTWRVARSIGCSTPKTP